MHPPAESPSPIPACSPSLNMLPGGTHTLHCLHIPPEPVRHSVCEWREGGREGGKKEGMRREIERQAARYPQKCFSQDTHIPGLPQWLRTHLPMQETWIQSLGQGKIPCRRKWLPIPAFLPGEIPRTEEPGRLQSMGWQRVRHDLTTKQQQKPMFQASRQGG